RALTIVRFLLSRLILDDNDLVVIGFWAPLNWRLDAPVGVGCRKGVWLTERFHAFFAHKGENDSRGSVIHPAYAEKIVDEQASEEGERHEEARGRLDGVHQERRTIRLPAYSALLHPEDGHDYHGSEGDGDPQQ